ncbi:hypothetical protein, variant [Phytophthora nicotianae P1569]|uniref:Uncharacterized protein n=1 Tax=Phytophthora nicotianae P1569 TaxID=1317065 RepID=V9EQJ3_PHYNI|nr:hypothetical protein, variant [Phytophthora nicotianae P1569]
MAAKAKKAASSSHSVKAKPTTAVVKVLVASSPPSPAAQSLAMRPTTPPPTPTAYQRLVALLNNAAAANGANRRVISTIEKLQTYVKASTMTSEPVKIRIKLLWISDHDYKEHKLVRLHCIDADSPEPLADLVELFLWQLRDKP